MTLRQAYEQLGLHQPEENFCQDTVTSCDSSSSGTTSTNSQSSFSTLTMSLDSADFYPSKPNSAVEFYGNPLRRGQRRRSHRHRPDHHLAKEEVGIMVTIQHLLPQMTHRLFVVATHPKRGCAESPRPNQSHSARPSRAAGQRWRRGLRPGPPPSFGSRIQPAARPQGTDLT